MAAFERGAMMSTMVLPSKQAEGGKVRVKHKPIGRTNGPAIVMMVSLTARERLPMGISAGWKNSRGANFGGKISREADCGVDKQSDGFASKFWGDNWSVGGFGGSHSLCRQSGVICPSPGLSYRPKLKFTVDARLLGPSIFNASKLRVLLLGSEKGDDKTKLLQQPRIYTLTHNDISAKITMTVAKEINKAQIMGWYSQFQRDEIVAEWRRTKGETSLHVHCHVSGGNFIHRLIARLRFYIFQKELPLVLEAFIHGDKEFFEQHPDLKNAPVWVYCHSHIEDYNRVECWGPLIDASKRKYSTPANENLRKLTVEVQQQFPHAAVCLVPCECCSRHAAVIPVPESLNSLLLQSRDVPPIEAPTIQDDHE